MRLLEYQAKQIFRERGINIPRGEVCRTIQDIEANFGKFADGAVLKAQVPSGKRGKGGGIKAIVSVEEARDYGKFLFSNNICGFPVQHVLLEEKIDWEHEYYLGIITDTESRYSCPMVLFTTAGGMDIEELLVEHPEYLHRLWVDPRYGLMDFQLRRLVKEAAIPKDIEKQVVATIRALYDIYWSHDAEIAEINPLGVTKDKKVVALDGKVTIDNSALFRQKHFEAYADNSREARAAAKGLSYVELDGDVGIISNGAGLTMATMDQMSLGGARPANFMDTGARILDNGIEDALDLLSERTDLRVILINVFGGGVRCDVIAQKISDAMAKRPDFSLPVVVCLQGRNHEIGHRIIEESGHPVLRLVRSMEEAVVTVTEAR